MKTIFKILIVIGFLFFFAQYTKAEDTLDTCWTMFYPHRPDKGYFNPDSVMIDTCATTNPQFPVLYAYKWYRVSLPIGALNVPEAPRDSLIYRNWRDIDTNFVELRKGFQNIENKFSTFIMRKEFPDDVDSGGSGLYLLKFEKYFNIDTVCYYLNQINGLEDAFYDMRASHWADNDVNDKNFDENQKTINIYPNPAKDFIKIEFQNQFNARKIQIISLEGIIILETEYKELIDISDLSTGVYFLKYADIVRKFIVYH